MKEWKKAVKYLDRARLQSSRLSSQHSDHTFIQCTTVQENDCGWTYDNDTIHLTISDQVSTVTAAMAPPMRKV